MSVNIIKITRRVLSREIRINLSISGLMGKCHINVNYCRFPTQNSALNTKTLKITYAP